MKKVEKKRNLLMVVSFSVLGIKSMNEICFLSMGLFQTFLQSISFYNMAAKAIYEY